MEFANFEIARRPLLGWGYQSFWLVGPDAPSIVDAPGWIKEMPSSHSGYLDTTVDMGYVGLVSLLIFLFATLHAIGRVADREPGRGWFLLTIALYVIVTNFIETGWMHGTDMLWLIFLIVVAETGRCWDLIHAGVPEPAHLVPAVAGRRPGIVRVRGSGIVRAQGSGIVQAQGSNRFGRSSEEAPVNALSNPSTGVASGATPLPSLRGHCRCLTAWGWPFPMVLVFHFVGQMQPTNWVERAVVGVTKYGSSASSCSSFCPASSSPVSSTRPPTKPHYFRNFYMRRVLRIFPLYYGVLALVFFVAPLIPLLRGPSLDYLLDRQAWAWFYGVNIYIAKEGDWSFSYLNHFWSLAVEEHFYIFWPLAVFLLARRPRALIAVSLLTSLCAMLARLIGLLMGASWLTTVVLTPFALDGLALGAFLAVMARQPGGLAWLVRALPRAGAITGGLCRHLRLDSPDVAPGTGTGSVGPGALLQICWRACSYGP